MRAYEQVEFTNMCMLQDAQGRILMQKRTGRWPGYALPGGHVEAGEPFTDSVIREIYEETGLTISNPRLCAVKDWMQEDGSRYVVFLFHASEQSGTLTSSSEGEVCWIDPASMNNLDLAKGMASTLEFFRRDDLTEQWFDASNGYAEIRK